MRVEEIMKTGVECVRPTDRVEVAAKKMRDGGVGFLPVCDDESKVIGTITDRDVCIRLVAESMPGVTPVAAIMTREIVACPPDADLSDAEDAMTRHHKSRLMCIDAEGKLIGVLSLSDIAEHELPDRLAETLRGIGAREIHA